jgi:hypothetical protein
MQIEKLTVELKVLSPVLAMWNRLEAAFTECQWTPHSLYSVFNQPDKDFYLGSKDGFIKKYQVFWSVARACMPKNIIELGCNAGSAMDAFLDAAGKDVEYVGYDVFGYDPKWGTYVPYEYIKKLAADRGYTNVLPVKIDLRTLTNIEPADFVMVDAAHDYRNERADLELALTANPRFIYVDDYAGADCQRAIVDFCKDHPGRVEWQIELKHLCDSMLMGMKL